MPLHIIDTAGLRESADKVEQIGIERAWQEIKQADRILLMVDASSNDNSLPAFVNELPTNIGITRINNKADKGNLPISASLSSETPVITLSAKTGEGLNLLTDHLKDCMGYQGSVEGSFMARRRHITALEKAQQHLDTGLEQLEAFVAGEILAEELRLCQQHLNEITGEFTSDDLLGQIFSSFCIGK